LSAHKKSHVPAGAVLKPTLFFEKKKKKTSHTKHNRHFLKAASGDGTKSKHHHTKHERIVVPEDHQRHGYKQDTRTSRWGRNRQQAREKEEPGRRRRRRSSRALKVVSRF
jgi:hypothetical protein